MIANNVGWLRRCAGCLIFAMCLSTESLHAEDGAWQLQKDTENIQVYSRPVADSAYLEVRGVSLLPAPAETVARVLLGDTSTCAQWVLTCREIRLLKVVSKREYYSHILLGFPWPLQDRDLVSRNLIEWDAAKLNLRVTMSPSELLPPQNNYIRAISQGLYLVKSINEQLVEFTWQVHTDFGGDVSPEVLNARLVDSTYQQMHNLINLFANP